MNRIESKKRKKGHKAVSKKLKMATEILLRHEGMSVIKGLVEDCREGQTPSAKLLYEIAHDAEEDAGNFRSLAFGLDRD